MTKKKSSLNIILRYFFLKKELFWDISMGLLGQDKSISFFFFFHFFFFRISPYIQGDWT